MRLRDIRGAVLIILLHSFHEQNYATAYQVGGRSPSLKPRGEFTESPVIKSLKRPVLTVVDPISNSRIHLVGVCHGSASSANLVKDIFAEINPAAVVLELCDDRFYSISLEANIRPRGNETQGKIFDDEMAVIKKAELKAKETSGVFGGLMQLSNVIRFVGQQGLVGGTFVLLSLCVNNLQRLFRFNTGTSPAVEYDSYSRVQSDVH